MLAARLGMMGYQTQIEPMLTIEPTGKAVPELDGYKALIFTSANGVRAFAACSRRRDLPAYAVGAGTGAALQQSGFVDIRSSDGNAKELAGLIGETVPRGARLLHLSGRAIAQDLKALLASSGIEADRVILYDAVPANRLSQGLVASLYARTIEYVLFFSPRTAGIFGTLAVQQGLSDAVRYSSALCLSPAVAEIAARLPWRHIGTARQPTTEALIQLLAHDNKHEDEPGHASDGH